MPCASICLDMSTYNTDNDLVKSAGTGAETNDAMGFLCTCLNMSINSFVLRISSCLGQLRLFSSTS